MSIEISPEYLLLNLSLYKEIEINTENLQTIYDFLSETKQYQVDVYCIHCQKESTFKEVLPGYGGYKSLSDSFTTNLARLLGTHNFKYLCQRNRKHEYYFYFKVNGNKIIKIGQYPAIADLELHKIEKYRKILSNDYRDFSKSLGLFSHGIGAGSFVYLRRIFENLIEESKELALQENSLDIVKYNQSRMDEKIELLSGYLPDILVENRKLYSILSKGIHELSEDVCLDLFPKVELAIELILDEKLAQKEKQNKVQQLKQFISSTVDKLK